MKQSHDNLSPWHAALLVVDMQYDFCEGGALAVQGAAKMFDGANAWVAWAVQHDLPVITSQDWHPLKHCSFAEQGGPWPVHCVQGTRGAALHEALHVPSGAWRVHKGCDADHDMYSALSGTVQGRKHPLPLYQALQDACVQQLYVLGIALEYCVYESAMEALARGFSVTVVVPACAGMAPASSQLALQKLQQAGAVLCYTARH